jgi:hypothetical protein
MFQFQKVFLKYLKEDMSAGDGGVFGDHSKSYADGDSRRPFAIGGIITRPGFEPNKKKRRRKKKSSKKSKCKTLKSSYRVEKGVDIRVISPKLPT